MIIVNSSSWTFTTSRVKRYSSLLTQYRSTLDLPYRDLLLDPGNHLVQDIAQRGFRTEAQQPFGLVDRGRAFLHIVLIGRIADATEGLRSLIHLLPDCLRQFQNSGAYGGGQIEVLVRRVGMLDANPDSPRQIPTIGVVPHLIAFSENMKRILALEHLLRQVGNDVRHGQLHISAVYVHVTQRAPFANSNAVEGADDCIRQAVLLPGSLDEVLGCQLLKAVGGPGRRTSLLTSFGSWILRGGLVDHAGGQHRDLLELAVQMRVDRSIEGGRRDAFVFRHQIVGEFVKIRNP